MSKSRPRLKKQTMAHNASPAPTWDSLRSRLGLPTRPAGTPRIDSQFPCPPRSRGQEAARWGRVLNENSRSTSEEAEETPDNVRKQGERKKYEQWAGRMKNRDRFISSQGQQDAQLAYLCSPPKRTSAFYEQSTWAEFLVVTFPHHCPVTVQGDPDHASLLRLVLGSVGGHRLGMRVEHVVAGDVRLGETIPLVADGPAQQARQVLVLSSPFPNLITHSKKRGSLRCYI